MGPAMSQSNDISTTTSPSCGVISLSASDPLPLGPASEREKADAISGKAMRTCSRISRAMSSVLRSATRDGPGWGSPRVLRSRREGWGQRTRWRQTGQVVAPLSHCCSEVSWGVCDTMRELWPHLQTVLVQPMWTVGQFHNCVVLLVLHVQG
jgi:hypothetical protein